MFFFLFGKEKLSLCADFISFARTDASPQTFENPKNKTKCLLAERRRLITSFERSDMFTGTGAKCHYNRRICATISGINIVFNVIKNENISQNGTIHRPLL